VPWLLALVGLAIPLISTGFRVWLLIVLWLLVLVAVWLTVRVVITTRRQRIGMALVLLPILFVLVFEGGWWLIPADLAWLVIELLDRRQATGRA
jgi:hypothetical protein